MTAIAKYRTIGLAIAGFILVADQWMKHFIVNDLGLDRIGEQYQLLPFFDFTRTNNDGVSLGMFQATSPEMRWGLVAVTAIIACVVLIWMLREKLLGDIIALGLILGGALGNIIDRYFYGYVIDYADLHIGEFRPFLIFNVADAAITTGVVIILARALFMREKEDSSQDAPQTQPDTSRES